MPTSKRSLAFAFIAGIFFLSLFIFPHSLFAQRLSGGSASKENSRMETQSKEESNTRSKPEREESSRSSSYSEPTPVYSAPAPVYAEPTPVYTQPSPTYSKPQPAYEAPAQDYSGSISSENTPSRSEAGAENRNNPTRTRKSKEVNSNETTHKTLGGFTEVSGQEKGKDLQIKNIEVAEAHVSAMFDNPRWNDSLFVNEVEGWLEEVNEQLVNLTGDDHAFHQHWYDEQLAIFAFQMAMQDRREMMLDYFRLKAIFLADISPNFSDNLSNRALRDSLFGMPDGGWDYLNIVQAWFPFEIQGAIALEWSTDPVIFMDFSFVQLKQFFENYGESDLKKHLDRSIEEQIQLAYSLESKDAEKSTFILENAYFLLRAGEMLSGRHPYYSLQIESLNNQYPGLPKLVNDNLPLPVAFFPDDTPENFPDRWEHERGFWFSK